MRRAFAPGLFAAVVGALMLAIVGVGAQFAYGQAAPSASGQSSGPPLQGCGPGGVHLCGTGGQPAITSCGTGPLVVGNDTAGRVLTGTAATACTITFATAWNAIPVCVVMGDYVTVAFSVTTTAISLLDALASSRYRWHCFGQPGG